MNAYEYFTQKYDVEKLSSDEQDLLYQAAGKLMKAMRNQYVTENSMNEYSSFAHGVEKDFGGDPTGELQNVIYEPEQIAESYAAGLVISYDSRGVPSVRSYWGLSMDEESLLRYLTHASVDQLMDDNGMEEDSLSDEAVTVTEDEVILVSDAESDQTYEEPIGDEGNRSGVAL